MYLWLKTKAKIVEILAHQRRMEDCADVSAVTMLESNAINDQFFKRLLMEADFKMKVLERRPRRSFEQGQPDSQARFAVPPRRSLFRQLPRKLECS